jgi:small GTP-binding protein
VTTRIVLQDKTYVFHIWDTAGQEFYRSLIPQYCRDADAALIVFDVTCRASYHSLDIWIRFLQDSTSNVPLVIFGNKADLADNRQIPRDESQNFASGRGFAYFEGSAKTGSNIQIVFNALAQSCAAALCEASQLDLVGQPLNLTETVAETPSSCC